MKYNSRKRSRIILILLIIIVLLSGAGIAYANRDTLINQYFLLTKSPKEYYTYIEQYGMYRLITSVPKQSTPEGDSNAYNLTSKISFNRGELDSVMSSAAGTSLKDLENMLGIPIDSVGLTMVHVSGDQKTDETIDIKLNDTKLITAELFLDEVAQKLSMRFPEISKAYLTASFDTSETSQGTYQEQLELLNTDILTRISKRYMELFFDRLKHVTLEKNVPLSLDTMAVICNQLTITITREEAEELFLTLFDTARADEDILSLLPLLHMTKDQYLQVIGEAESAIYEELEEHSDEDALQMKLFVDRSGHILSRELTTFGYSTFGYTFLGDEDYKEYELHLTHGATDRKLSIHGQ
ncbi:MAG: hypothetical protein K0R46_2664, partial [Herbinix sp.]|nr:hypothetical protein [Herbinix sp.]